MWSKAHRARHAAQLKSMVSFHAVGHVARWLERADPPRSGRATSYARVVSLLAWHLRVGGAWRALPRGLLPWRMAYGWFRRWQARGLLSIVTPYRRANGTPNATIRREGGGTRS